VEKHAHTAKLSKTMSEDSKARVKAGHILSNFFLNYIIKIVGRGIPPERKRARFQGIATRYPGVNILLGMQCTLDNGW